MDIKIIDATIEDAEFIEKCVLAAVQLYDLSNPDANADPSILDKCKRADTLYSYKNVRIALSLDGKPLGCLVAYPGTIYKEARNRTFVGLIPGEDMECKEDEYYLDSMALLPEARHNNLGKILIMDAISKGLKMGFKKFSLIALNKPDHDHLRDYYASLGFEPKEEITFFNEKYTRMLKDKIFKHIVMWKFSGDVKQRTESANWMKEHLEALVGKIPGLLSAEVLVGTDKEQDYDALLDTSFISPEYFASYKVHPEHVKVSEYCKKVRESRTSFDAWR